MYNSLISPPTVGVLLVVGRVGSMLFHLLVITSGLTFANLFAGDGGETKTDESTI